MADIEQIATRYVASLTAIIAAMNEEAQTAQTNECSPNLRLIEKLNSTADENEPVFCIHPVTGRVTGYQRLAQALEGERSVFGIKSKSFISDDVFDTSFADMAETYYQTIKQIQPCGPYRLVGWSLGGALAQEIVNRLKNDDDVAFVGLLDCYVPGTEISEDQWDSPISKTKLIEHISLLLGSITKSKENGVCSCSIPWCHQDGQKCLIHGCRKISSDRYADNAKQMLYSWAVEQHMRALCRGYVTKHKKPSCIAGGQGSQMGAQSCYQKG